MKGAETELLELQLGGVRLSAARAWTPCEINQANFVRWDETA